MDGQERSGGARHSVTPTPPGRDPRHVPAARDYLLGTDDSELERLAFQHRVWADDVRASWQRAGFGVGHRILDLGCGPGFATVELAHLVGPSGRVVAVDGSERFLHLLRERAKHEHLTNIEPVQIDVEALELEPTSLDGAYARWILCFLGKPERVVASIARALKPGARLLALDNFNYASMALAPPSTALVPVLQAVRESWKAAGGDLDVQGRLPQIGRAHGLDLEWVKAITHVARPGEPLWQWAKMFFASYVPRLISEGRISEDVAAAFADAWRDREARADSFLQLQPMYEVGLRRANAITT